MLAKLLLLELLLALVPLLLAVAIELAATSALEIPADADCIVLCSCEMLVLLASGPALDLLPLFFVTCQNHVMTTFQ